MDYLKEGVGCIVGLTVMAWVVTLIYASGQFFMFTNMKLDSALMATVGCVIFFPAIFIFGFLGVWHVWEWEWYWALSYVMPLVIGFVFWEFEGLLDHMWGVLFKPQSKPSVDMNESTEIIAAKPEGPSQSHEVSTKPEGPGE